MSATDVRGSVQRHVYFDLPMWRVKVFDGDRTVAVHFVIDWAEALDLANRGVLQFRQRREEFAARLKQQILDAYGFDQWPPQEQAIFEVWGRIEDALRAEREAFAEGIVARANALAPRLPGLVAGGLRFEWRES